MPVLSRARLRASFATVGRLGLRSVMRVNPDSWRKRVGVELPLKLIPKGLRGTGEHAKGYPGTLWNRYCPRAAHLRISPPIA